MHENDTHAALTGNEVNVPRSSLAAVSGTVAAKLPRAVRFHFLDGDMAGRPDRLSPR